MERVLALPYRVFSKDQRVFLVAAVPRNGGVVEGPGCPTAVVGAGAIIEVPTGIAVIVSPSLHTFTALAICGTGEGAGVGVGVGVGVGSWRYHNAIAASLQGRQVGCQRVKPEPN